VTSTTIRVFIVDDHPVSRLGLAALIQAEDGVECVGEAADGTSAAPYIAHLRPDIVLTDLCMPRADGVTLVQRLASDLPGTRFIVLAETFEPTQVQRAFDAGARAFLDKTVSVADLARTIRQVHSGYLVVKPEIVEAMRRKAQSPMSGLTLRERQILTLMAQGHRNQAIADRLNIAGATVKFHVTNILGKLYVDNRSEAMLLALRHGLCDVESAAEKVDFWPVPRAVTPVPAARSRSYL
jgi:NarL family two-component system response regulator LiaR